jgi:DNA-binding MarR family transcriptional regulator
LDEQTQLLREMRDLLLVIAEPALAKRDERLRTALKEIVGKSRAKAKAIVLMDGSRSPSAIYKESGIDQGDLSRLLKTLRSNSLIKADEKYPQLVISLPPNFFEKVEKQDE